MRFSGYHAERGAPNAVRRSPFAAICASTGLGKLIFLIERVLQRLLQKLFQRPVKRKLNPFQNGRYWEGLKAAMKLIKRVSAINLGFNRSLQHIKLCVSRRSVADEAKTPGFIILNLRRQ
jgi:hypothetical protein